MHQTLATRPSSWMYMFAVSLLAPQLAAANRPYPAPRHETPEEVLSPAFEPARDGPPLDDPRAVPDLDGREPETQSGALWIPRLVLAPLYVVNEYLLRWPLGKAIVFVERHHIIDYAKEIFTFRDGSMGVFPVFRVDHGTAPAIGFYSFADGLFFDRHEMRLSGDTDFGLNFHAVFLNRLHLIEDELTLNVRLSLEQRDDFVFFGTGGRTLETNESRFGRRKVMGIAEIERAREGPGFKGRLSVEVSDNHFFCSERTPSLCGPDELPLTQDDRHRARGFAGYQLVRIKAHTALDSRVARRGSGTGVRLDLFGRWGHGLGSDIHFVRYGGELSLYWELWRQRVLAFRVMTELFEPIGDGRVPFAELITLGGVETMRGFLHARFHGRSAVVATLDYRYPVWSNLDGTIFFEVGNTFDRHFDDFHVKRFRSSAGIGVRTNMSRDVSFDMLFAVGTTPLGVGDFGIDFVRASIGTNLGF